MADDKKLMRVTVVEEALLRGLREIPLHILEQGGAAMGLDYESFLGDWKRGASKAPVEDVSKYRAFVVVMETYTKAVAEEQK